MFRIPDSERHSHVKFYCLYEREERKIERERQRSKKKLDASSLHSALTILWLLTYEHEKMRVTSMLHRAEEDHKKSDLDQRSK